MRYVVCAGTTDEAAAWARAQGIPPSQCIYASSVSKIDGLRDFVVVRLRGFFSRPDQDEIEACLRRCEMKMPSPLARLASRRDLAGG